MNKPLFSILTIVFLFLSGFNIYNVSSETIKSTSNSNFLSLEYTFNQINQDGFGSIENVGTRGIEIFNGSLITATANYNNDSKITLGGTYEFNEFMDTYSSLGRFEDGLYSNGLEVLSYNGSEWRFFISKL